MDDEVARVARVYLSAPLSVHGSFLVCLLVRFGP